MLQLQALVIYALSLVINGVVRWASWPLTCDRVLTVSCRHGIAVNGAAISGCQDCNTFCKPTCHGPHGEAQRYAQGPGNLISLSIANQFRYKAKGTKKIESARTSGFLITQRSVRVGEFRAPVTAVACGATTPQILESKVFVAISSNWEWCNIAVLAEMVVVVLRSVIKVANPGTNKLPDSHHNGGSRINKIVERVQVNRKQH